MEEVIGSENDLGFGSFERGLRCLRFGLEEGEEGSAGKEDEGGLRVAWVGRKPRGVRGGVTGDRWTSTASQPG